MKLIKEIKSREGEVHFRRYAILETRWFSIWVHEILKADEDRHLHDHPFHFWALILKGGYLEKVKNRINERNPGNLSYHSAKIPHKISELKEPTWTLIFASHHKRAWGYHTEAGWVDHQTYREEKHRGTWRADNWMLLEVRREREEAEAKRAES